MSHTWHLNSLDTLVRDLGRLNVNMKSCFEKYRIGCGAVYDCRLGNQGYGESTKTAVKVCGVEIFDASSWLNAAFLFFVPEPVLRGEATFPIATENASTNACENALKADTHGDLDYDFWPVNNGP